MSSPRDWVEQRLGIQIETLDSPFGLQVEDLVGLALRRNPKRAHLLVSTVLGKHVPTDPRLVYGSGLLLGALVHHALTGTVPQRSDGDSLARALQHDSLTDAMAFGLFARQLAAGLGRLRPAPVVLGYCETATGLGHCVADALPGSDYLHSTRRRTEVAAVGGFEEEHSHATSHLLCPRDPALLVGDRAATRPLVLVDDELTTGRTVLNTISELHGLAARPRYVIAALVDMRSAQDEAAMAARADELGVRIDVVALARGRISLPDGLPEQAAALVAELPVTLPTASAYARRSVPRHHGEPGVLGGRHGISAQQRIALRDWCRAEASARYVPRPGERMLVLGTEELMAAPLLLAQACADAEPTATVRFSSTTRSPALAVDDPGYPLRTAISFASAEAAALRRAGRAAAEEPVVRFAYNVVPGAGQPEWDSILVVLDEAALGADGSESQPDGSGLDGLELDGSGEQGLSLRAAVIRPGPRYAEVVLTEVGPTEVWPTEVVPAEPEVEAEADAERLAFPAPLTGPEFGSYGPDEVRWLLTDLSHVQLEAPTTEREREIQAGRAHYAESLPIEFQPDQAYTALFHQAVAESATRLAYDVGLVAEIVRHERLRDGASPGVLVSLARAGVPVGILLRRWYRFARDEDVPHYAISIVRGRGIDTLALRYLVAHEPGEKIFVDGWTGKGAITRELAQAIEQFNAAHHTGLDPEMVVLADPGRCVRTFGTRDDFLIPSACLNSTVSGLVSRTVLNDQLIGPSDFHGAKFYADLADADVSHEFLDAVSSRFGEVADRVAADWPSLAASDRTPDWAGWAAVEQISQRYRIGQVNLVKPGVGETTRVLLRRVPERILIRPGNLADLRHVLVLADQRGVPVEEVDGLPYSCVGLIRPQEGGEG